MSSIWSRSGGKRTSAGRRNSAANGSEQMSGEHRTDLGDPQNRGTRMTTAPAMLAVRGTGAGSRGGFYGRSTLPRCRRLRLPEIQQGKTER